MQGWTEQVQYEGNQLLPLPVGKIIESESGNNTLTVTESGVNLNFTESTNVPYTNDIYVFGNSQYNIEAGYEDASAYIPKGLYTLITDIVSNNVEVFISVWRDGVKLDLVQGTTPKPANFTLLEGDKIRIGLRPKNTLDISNATLMVIKQTLPSTTPYEPYTGGAPSPSPDYPQAITSAGDYDESTGKYQYEVKLTGKNLFCLDRLLSLIPGSGSESLSVMLKVTDLIPNTIYTLSSSIEGDLSGDFRNRCLYIGDTSATNSVFADHPVSMNSGDSGEIIVFFYPFRDVSQDIKSGNGNVQLEIGTRETSYEPYRTPQTVTLTSDHPLTKWDKLEKRNGQWGWVYKSAEVVLDGSEDWVLAQTDNYNQFYINIDDTIEHSNSTKNVYCEKFRSALIADRETEKEIIYTVLVPGNFGGIAVSTDLATEVDAWKTWLQSNAIRALYKSTEETFVPLTAEEQEQMNALHTFHPTTVLSNDAGCEMSLTYKTKKSLEVTT